MRFNENDKSLKDFKRALTDYMRLTLDKMLPCIVTEVSQDRTRVSVLPVIRTKLATGDFVSKAEIPNLTVASFGAGGIVSSFPIKVGNTGWIETSDRDISLFLASLEESDSNTERKHSFSDSRFIPDIFKGFSIAAEDDDAMVIQTLDGGVKIAIDDSQVRIVNGLSRFEVNDGTINMTAPNGINMNGAVINGEGVITDGTGITSNSHYHTQEPDSEGDAQAPTSKPAGNL